MADNSELRRSNPWWVTPESIEDDTKLVAKRNSVIDYDPSLRKEIQFDPPGSDSVLYTMRGPRQIGKTTLMKLQISDFLKRGVNPWNIFYYSFDLADSKQGIVDVIDAYLKMSNRIKGNERTYFLLDEISAVDDWGAAIKWLWDCGHLENSTIFVTGSQAPKITSQSKRLSGRRGHSTDPHDRAFSPMKFAEFVGICDKKIGDFVRKGRLCEPSGRREIFYQLASGKIPGDLEGLSGRYLDGLNDCLYEYALTGGIPRIIDEKFRLNHVGAGLYAEYVDGIESDWKGQGRTPLLLQQFCRAIIASYGSGTNWNSLRSLSQLGSWATAQEYGLMLEEMLLATVIRQYGEKRKIPLISKGKKIYFRDPFYLHIFNSSSSSADPFLLAEEYISDDARYGSMVEGIVADHLIRLAFALSKNRHAFDYGSHVMFWKNGNNREVDFVMYQGNDLELPIEVKIRNSVYARELTGLTSFLDVTGARGGLVLSKNEMDVKRDYLLVPASVFLMLV